MPEQPNSSSSNGVLILIGVIALFAVFATEGQPMHFRDDSVTGSTVPIPPAPLPPPPAEPSPQPGPPKPAVAPVKAAPASGPAAMSAPPAAEATQAVTPAPASAVAKGSASPARDEGNDAFASIDKDDVREAIRSLKPQFLDCYTQALAHRPKLGGGKVTVEFTLARDVGAGSVVKDGSIAESSLSAPLVEACILEKLRAAKFPEMKGEAGTVKVRYPLVFTRDGG